MQFAEGGNVEHEHGLHPQRAGERVDGCRRVAHLLAADVQSVEQRARRHGQRGFREARSSGAKDFPLYQPTARQCPGSEDGDHPAAAAHDTARCTAASNACWPSGRSTTNDTCPGNCAPPWCACNTVAMISAESSSVRLPAPVPSGGALTCGNCHSWAWCSADSQARATLPRVTGSDSLRITAWITNSAGKSPPAAV